MKNQVNAEDTKFNAKYSHEHLEFSETNDT